MREIKFRAQDYTGTWRYGYIVQDTIVPVNKSGSAVLGINIYVKTETIGQFTGLHDKNGKEIYEGDIVTMIRTPEKRQRLELVRHVVACHNVCDWVFESLAHEVLGLMMANHSNFDSYKFEVVGNIFDNPELAQHYSLNKPERKPRKRTKKNPQIEIISNGIKTTFNVSQEDMNAIIDEMTKE
jgi:uncharacterized phage protein (TIGR01671 family)